MSHVSDQTLSVLRRLGAVDPAERVKAVEQLARSSHPAAGAGLVAALNDEDWLVRDRAYECLRSRVGAMLAETAVPLIRVAAGDISAELCHILEGCGRSAEAALLGLVDDSQAGVRLAVVRLLAVCGSIRAVAPLCQCLHDGDAAVVAAAAETLGELGSAKAVDDLLELAGTEQPAASVAVRSLGRIGGPKAVSRLVEMLAGSEAEKLREIVDALGHIGNSEVAASILARAEMVPSIRLAGVMAACRIGARTGKSVPGLDRRRLELILADASLTDVSPAASYLISQVGQPTGVEYLKLVLAHLSRFDPEQRAILTDLLRQMDQPQEMIADCLEGSLSGEILPLLELLMDTWQMPLSRPLAGLLDDPRAEVRRKAAQVMGAAGWPGCVADLKKLAVDPNGHVRGAAFAALGRQAGEEELNFLWTGLDDMYPDVRRTALGAVALIGGEEVQRRLTADLEHESAERRRLAIKGQGIVGDYGGTLSLTAVLRQSDPTLRREALLALARIGRPVDIEPIVLATRDEEPAVRRAAASCLGSLLGALSLPELLPLLDDIDPLVRHQAVTVLASFGPRLKTGVLDDVADDQSELVRQAVARYRGITHVNRTRRSSRDSDTASYESRSLTPIDLNAERVQ